MRFDTPKAGLKTLNHRSDWTTARLKFLFKRETRPVLETDEVVTAFRDGTVTLRKNRREDGFTFAELEIGYQGIEPGDLVIHAMDGFAGAIGVSDSRGKGSPVLTIATPIANAEPSFWAYYLRNLAVIGFIQSLAKGIRERSTDFRWKDASNLLVNFPDLATQRQIADFLDRETARIDLLIEKKQRLVALLGEKTAETVRQCVSCGMDSSVPKKPSRVPAADDLAAHWTERRLSTICRFVQGKAHEPFIEDDGEYICVTARFVSTNGEKFRRCTKNLTPGKVNDIAMVMSDLPNGRALARAFFVDQDDLYAINQRVCVITVMEGDPRFFFYQLNRNLQLMRYNDGFNQTHLPNRAFTQLFLKVPPVDEQKRIADYLEAVSKHTNAVIEKTNASINRLKEYRAALITAAVTGQIDVSTYTKSGTPDRRLDAIQEKMGA